MTTEKRPADVAALSGDPMNGTWHRLDESPEASAQMIQWYAPETWAVIHRHAQDQYAAEQRGRDESAARIAAVEALADHYGGWDMAEVDAAEVAIRLRAALDGDPTLATVRADAGRDALLAMADEIDRGPTFPLPPSVISALIRERAEAVGDDHA